ncbi:MAG: hypothetical protein PHF37_01080 [Phycisphaerae bacterium]|nr:hypothetical protein [Phycisphaerae bacterium]
MIKFRCHECGQVMRADESEAGKKVRCFECGQATVVPAASQDVKKPRIIKPAEPKPKPIGEDVEKHAADHVGITKKIVITVLILLLAALAVIAVYMFVSRDTWEKDNAAKINSMIGEADAYVQASQYPAALEIYYDLFNLVKGHEIKNQFRAEAIKDAKLSFQMIKKTYAPRLKNELSDQLAEADTNAEAGKEQLAIEQYDQIIKTLSRYGYGETEFAELRTAVRERRQAAQDALAAKTPQPQERIEKIDPSKLLPSQRRKLGQ